MRSVSILGAQQCQLLGALFVARSPETLTAWVSENPRSGRPLPAPRYTPLRENGWVACHLS